VSEVSLSLSYVPGGWFDGSLTTSRFDHPYGVSSDYYNRIYVGDTGNNKIRVISRQYQREAQLKQVVRVGEKLMKRYKSKRYAGMVLNEEGEEVREDDSVSFGDQDDAEKKYQVKPFIKPGEKVYYVGEDGQQSELVEVVDVNHNREEGNILIKHTWYGRGDFNQEVHESYLEPVEHEYEKRLEDPPPKQVDIPESRWEGVYPTPKPTVTKMVAHQHLEFTPFQVLDNQFMLTQELGDPAEKAPGAATPMGTYQGQGFDVFGNPITNAEEVHIHTRDPKMVYKFGRTDHPKVALLGKEKREPFQFELDPVNTGVGVLHTVEPEIDPDQYADWAEEDQLRFPNRPVWDPEDVQFPFRPQPDPLPPNFKLLSELHEVDMEAELLKRSPTDIAPRSPILTHFYDKSVGPPPEMKAAKRQQQSQYREYQQDLPQDEESQNEDDEEVKSYGELHRHSNRHPPPLSQMPEMVEV